MMNKTGIPYLDYTWNPTHGCSPCSLGCDNCWARAMSKRLAGMGVKGYDKANPFKPTFHAERLDEPLKLKKPSVIGVSFMGDLYHPDITDEQIARVYETMWMVNRHTYVVLTKRPQRLVYEGPPPSTTMNHVWWGVTVCTQAEADEKIPILLSIPAAHRWISIEPMLGPIDLEPFLFLHGPSTAGPWRDVLGRRRGGGGIGGQMISSRPSGDISWLVVGSESGPHRRPMEIEWAESVVDQCLKAGVPIFVKQITMPNGKVSTDPSEWPESLRVRQLPWGAI